MALEALGIPYRFVAARPMFYPARRPKTHMAFIAEVESRQWLCDLGFGSYGIRAPMALDTLDVDITQDFDTFRLSRSAEGEYLLQAKVEGEWARQYGFDLTPQEWIDFVPANYLNSTHPDAIFVQKLVVVQHRPEGREILLGDMLKTITAKGLKYGNWRRRNPPYAERAFCVDRGVKQRGGLLSHCPENRPYGWYGRCDYFFLFIIAFKSANGLNVATPTSFCASSPATTVVPY
jgi:hypothetical protein